MAKQAQNGNLPSKEIITALIREEARLEEAKKNAQAAVTAHHKKIKALGIDVKDFVVIYQQATASDGGDSFIQSLRTQKRLAEALNLPIGHQFDIFDDFEAVERAKDKGQDDTSFNYQQQGMRAFLRGDAEADCPHSPNSTGFNEWVQGFRMAETWAQEGREQILEKDAEDSTEDKGENQRDAKRRPGRTSTKKAATKKATTKRATRKK